MESASREDVLLFAGPANPVLARAIAGELGMDVAACDFARFPDGEISARIEPSVRGRHVVLVQPTAPPVNDHLMSLLAFTDACRRSAAASVTAVVPYFGYARSDRRQGLRVPVMGSLVAQLMESAGVDHVVTVDVHAPQLEGFFRIAVDNLTAAPTLADAIRDRIGPNGVVVAPDLGAARLATTYGRLLGLPVAVVHKLRRSATEVTSAGITGDVAGRQCLIVDDMITTGGTVESAARAVLAARAEPPVVIAATHGVLTGDAWERLARVGIGELLLTDSIAIEARHRPPTRVVSIAPLLADAIRRTSAERIPEPAHLFGSG